MKKKLNKIVRDTNLFLLRFLAKQKKTDLIKSMKYGVIPGGKKIRSKLIADVGKIFKIKYQNLIQIGAAVECIHAYSLIHDDLPCMDNDSLRRGRLSTHKKFGESTAILAGNSLLTIAFEILSQNNFKLNDKIKIKLVNLISVCSGHSGIAGGQYSDLSFERKKIPLKKIIEMQIRKTGKLFSFCCSSPAIIAKKNPAIANMLYCHPCCLRKTFCNCILSKLKPPRKIAKLARISNHCVASSSTKDLMCGSFTNHPNKVRVPIIATIKIGICLFQSINLFLISPLEIQEY